MHLTVIMLLQASVAADEQRAESAQLQIQVSKEQVKKLKTVLEESCDSCAAAGNSRTTANTEVSEVRQQLACEQRKVQVAILPPESP